MRVEVGGSLTGGGAEEDDVGVEHYDRLVSKERRKVRSRASLNKRRVEVKERTKKRSKENADMRRAAPRSRAD